MFTPLSSNAVSAYSCPQIWFPQQRVGTQQKVTQIQKPTARNLQPQASNAVRVSPAGDSFQSSRPVSGTTKKSNVTEQSASDIPTEAFTRLGASMGSIFGIQV
jgi:hypothetical protein